ncbi:hypothetical protein MRX96_005364 [Rhipicephalus microplus]
MSLGWQQRGAAPVTSRGSLGGWPPLTTAASSKRGQRGFGGPLPPSPIRAAARSPGRKHIAPAASAAYLGRATLAGVAGRFLGLRVAAALATLRRALHFARGSPAAWGTPAAYFGSPGPVARRG